MTTTAPAPLQTWPDLAAVPDTARSRVASRIARRLFHTAVSRLDVSVLLDGETLGRGGPAMTVHDSADFFARLGRDGLIGFGESYLVGSWDAPDLGGFLTVLAAELPTLVPEPLQRLRAAYVRRPPRHQRSSLTNSRANIGHHYDLSNDLFETFLDETLSYSSALFEAPVEDRGEDPLAAGGRLLVAGEPVESPDIRDLSRDIRDLSAGQVRKIERLLDATGVGEGTRVLEIGTGWGELALRAARRGATVHTVTLSSEQQALAQQRIDAAGLADRVRIDLRDYRTIEGEAAYDVIVSVEMIEAVGHEFWGEYAATLDRLLAPGGRVGLQAITMPHDRMLATRRTYTWINKYVFPGGFLPSIQALDEVLRSRTGLRIAERLSFGSHYAATLAAWDRAFQSRSARVEELGFDAIFRRMWHFYLEYSRAGFASGYIDVNQLILTRPDEAEAPTATTSAADATGPGTDPATGVAPRLAEALRPVLRGDLPVRLHAWDGSSAGPADAPEVRLTSPDAVRRLLRHPGELGAAQAYVTGELDVPETGGWDLDSALTHAHLVALERDLAGTRPTLAQLATLTRTLAGIGVLGRPPAPPRSQAQVRGRLHSLGRDRSAISFHYDLSNDFYAAILDDHMAYSSAYWTQPPGTEGYGLEDAQGDKLDLICRKLGLTEGSRLLDVGCGWGALSLHAAQEYGARVVGVTIAAEQKRFIDARIAERGLGDRVEIRLQDYREVPERGVFDAVGSVEMGEHVGEGNYPTYADALARAVRPGGRVLVQQMSRKSGHHPGGGPFIESFIAPDMHMRPVGETVAHLEGGGLEVRDVHALREHYVWTVDGWLKRFEAAVPRLTEMVGEEVVRVWRLYLVGGRMAFRDGRMGVDQILLVRPGAPHGLAPVRDFDGLGARG